MLWVPDISVSSDSVSVSGRSLESLVFHLGPQGRTGNHPEYAVVLLRDASS